MIMTNNTTIMINTTTMAKVHLVFLTIPATGHVLSTAEMAKRLVAHRPSSAAEFDISATVLIPSSTLISTALNTPTIPAGLPIDFRRLPDVELTDIQDVEDFLSRLLQSQKPHVKDVLAGLIPSYSSVALFIDMFGTAVIDVADELGVPCYVYFTSGAFLLCLLLSLPFFHERIAVDYEEYDGELEIPGMTPLPMRALPGSLKKRNLRSYEWFLYHSQRFRETKGIVVNTFAELESRALRALAEPEFVPGGRTPPVYAVGPVLVGLGDSTGGEGDQHECLSWLDGQPSESVVFLCFGSEGSFEAEQVIEMASALEHSGHRFLWALRIRSKEAKGVNIEDVLPDGFVERTKNRGFVWPSWVPQVQVLAHQAVGGFVTHCGWNSCLESLWHGVPMLGWPLYAEQHGNAFVMATDMGVALELVVDRKKDNYVGAEELERGVRCLMETCEEGERVRARVKELKIASRKAMGIRGSSFEYMEKLVKELRTTSHC